jgi:hypothetical protein
MTVIMLQRFVPEPRIKRRRFGPDNRVAALMQSPLAAPLPVVVAVGPPGANGNDGGTGPEGPAALLDDGFF